jgi:hypothetical protein
MDLVHIYTFDSMHRRCLTDPDHFGHVEHLRALRQEVRREHRRRMARLLRPRPRPSGVATSSTGRTATTTGGYV